MQIWKWVKSGRVGTWTSTQISEAAHLLQHNTCSTKEYFCSLCYTWVLFPIERQGCSIIQITFLWFINFPGLLCQHVWYYLYPVCFSFSKGIIPFLTPHYFGCLVPSVSIFFIAVVLGFCFFFFKFLFQRNKNKEISCLIPEVTTSKSL